VIGVTCSICGRVEKFIQSYRGFEGKGPLGKPRHRWEGNVKIDLKETGCKEVDWWAFVSTLMNLSILQKMGNFLLN
jgi:hypothetical protein